MCIIHVSRSINSQRFPTICTTESDAGLRACAGVYIYLKSKIRGEPGVIHNMNKVQGRESADIPRLDECLPTGSFLVPRLMVAAPSSFSHLAGTCDMSETSYLLGRREAERSWESLCP